MQIWSGPKITNCRCSSQMLGKAEFMSNAWSDSSTSARRNKNRAQIKAGEVWGMADY